MIDLSEPIETWMSTQIYVGHRAGMPDVIMGRWPPQFGRRKPYKTWICESRDEFQNVQDALARPCPRQGGALDLGNGPDKPVSAAAFGMSPRGELVIALYPSPADGWPWLVLISIPLADPGMERGRYAWEALPSENAALDHIEKLARMSPEAERHFLLPGPTS